MEYVLGKKLTQEQVNALPNGMKIFVKEPEISWLKDSIYIIYGSSIQEIEGNSWCYISNLDSYNLTAYEVCVFDDMQEVTTQEELLSLEDGTYVFVDESSRNIENVLCVKQEDRANEVHGANGYDLLDLKYYQERGVKFYVDKNIKLTKEETTNIEIKTKDGRMSIYLDKDYSVFTDCDVTDSESDKLEAMSSLLKNLSEEFERRSEKAKHEEFTPNQWVSFLNSEIGVKCATEEKAKEFLGILHSMGYTWSSRTSLEEKVLFSKDGFYEMGAKSKRLYYCFNTEKPVFLYK